MEKIPFNFIYGQTAHVAIETLEKLKQKHSSYIKYLHTISKQKDYQCPEASLQIPFDTEILKNIRQTAHKFKSPRLKYIVVIGIGGSNLGTIALYEALYSKLDVFDHTRLPKILFLDTVSSKNAFHITDLLKTCSHSDEFALITISKSGGTAETLANFEVLTHLLKDMFDDILDRTILITDQDSKLWIKAGELNITRLPIPQKVGGRYSVFSAVGLFPLYLADINIEEIIKGAQAAITDGTCENTDVNYAFISAALSYIHNNEGKIIHNTFLFNPELESCGKWYRQLMGESIGKEKNKEGDIVRTGITPIISIGSTDLHSMAQLYFGGPNNKFTHIVYCKNKKPVSVPNESILNLVPSLHTKSFTEIMNAIIGGVQAAYTKNDLPYVTIQLNELNAYTLGYYLQFRMIEMMYLAEFLNVNAFDQPNVEDYKSVTKELLG